MKSRDGGTHRKGKSTRTNLGFLLCITAWSCLGGGISPLPGNRFNQEVAALGRNLGAVCSPAPPPSSGWVSSCPVLLEPPPPRLGLHQGAGSLLGVNLLLDSSPPLLALGRDLTWPVQPCVLAAAWGWGWGWGSGQAVSGVRCQPTSC